MKAPKLMAAGAVLGLAGSCGSAAVQTQAYQDPSLYSYRDFSKYHAERDTEVDVVGDTLGTDRAAFAKAVTSAMYGANSGRPARFTTAPGPSAEKNLRVVMAFNTEPRAFLCDSKRYPPRPGGEGTYLQAAWCWDDRTLSYVQARASGTVKPGDETFRRLVAAATRDLFPQFMDNKLRDNNDRRRP